MGATHRMAAPWLVPLLLSLSLCHGALILPLQKRVLHPHAALPWRARSALGAMPADIADLQTEGLGQYSVAISLGSPPQTQLSTLDTGSGVIHVPCASANAASRAADTKLPLFNPSASTTISGLATCSSSACRTLCGPGYPNIPCPDLSNYSDQSCSSTRCGCTSQNVCRYAIEYADLSGGDGVVYTDKAILNGNPSTAMQLSFGCATNFTRRLFTDKSPYFVGLNWQPGSLLSQLQAQGIIDDTFGICLGNGAYDVQQAPFTSSDYGYNAPTAHGLLVLGSAKLTTPLTQVFSTYTIDTGSYNSDYSAALRPGQYPGGPLFAGLWMEMTAATIGGASLMPAGAAGYPMLLDSGTSLAAFPGVMANALIAAFVPALRKATGVVRAAYDPTYSSGIAVVFSSTKTPTQLDAIPNLPTLDLTLGPPGATIVLPLSPSRYLYPNSTRWPDNVWVFLLSQDFGSSQSGILGNSVMRNLWIQATESTRAITIGLLDVEVSCDTLTFANATIATAAPPPPAPPGGDSSSSSSNNNWKIAVGVGVGVGVVVLLLGVGVGLYMCTEQAKVVRMPANPSPPMPAQPFAYANPSPQTPAQPYAYANPPPSMPAQPYAYANPPPSMPAQPYAYANPPPPMPARTYAGDII